MSEFAGFTEAALDFYDDIELDNTKSFWTAHRDVYERQVRAPMIALCAALEPQFGTAKIYRPYRDVRFAKDKTPYKTHQGAFVAAGPATGWYCQIGAPGFRVGTGFYHAEGPRLARFREAVADDVHGVRLQQVVDALVAAGWELGGDRLKTSPRGYDSHHPRIGLLRHRTLSLGRHYAFDPVIFTPGLVDRVRADWEQARPLVQWVVDVLGPDA